MRSYYINAQSISLKKISNRLWFVSEAASWADLLRELSRQEFVVLGIQLMQIFWYRLIRLIVQWTEWNHLVRVSKNLNCLTRGLNNLRLVVFDIFNWLLMGHQLWGGVRRGHHDLLRNLALDRWSLESLELQSLLLQLLKLRGCLETLEVGSRIFEISVWFFISLIRGRWSRGLSSGLTCRRMLILR